MSNATGPEPQRGYVNVLTRVGAWLSLSPGSFEQVEAAADAGLDREWLHLQGPEGEPVLLRLQDVVGVIFWSAEQASEQAARRVIDGGED